MYGFRKGGTSRGHQGVVFACKALEKITKLSGAGIVEKSRRPQIAASAILAR